MSCEAEANDGIKPAECIEVPELLTDVIDDKYPTDIHPDNAHWLRVLEYVKKVADGWCPVVRLIGNARAGDISKACDAALKCNEEHSDAYGYARDMEQANIFLDEIHQKEINDLKAQLLEAEKPLAVIIDAIGWDGKWHDPVFAAANVEVIATEIRDLVQIKRDLKAWEKKFDDYAKTKDEDEGSES